MIKINFSINEYDSDGDIIDKGVYLHFENTRILVADGVEEFIKEFPPKINQIIKGIEENYQ